MYLKTVCLAESKPDGSVPDEIKILPLGHVTSKKGAFLVDDQSWQMILSEFKRRKLDLVVDYEHQTLTGQQAPAGGWIKELHKGDDAIVAKVEWTPKAREYLQNKEYRYLSPVIKVRKSDGRVSLIHSVALTNTPAIDGMYAVCRDDEMEDDEMEIAKLAKALGLGEDATEEQILGMIGDLMKTADQKEEIVANSTILSLLELSDEAKTEEVSAKIMSLKAGDAALKARIDELERKNAQDAADQAVQKALKDGKICAAQKDWAQAYALKDPEGFEKFTEQAPQQVPMGKTALKDAELKDGLEDATMQVLKNCGLSKEDYEKYYKEDK